jgi:Ca2+-binding EF-hand superfamily protein
LQTNINREYLTATVNELDENGNGSISLDEFLTFFGHEMEDDDDFHKAQED